MPMQDEAAWLINATPSSSARAKTEDHILTVCRRKQPVKTSQLKELFPINSHKAAGGKQGMTGLLMLRIKVPAVKAVFECKAGRATGNCSSLPIVTSCRNGENIWRFEVP